MDICLLLLFMLSGRGLCNGMNPRPVGPTVCGLSQCDMETSNCADPDRVGPPCHKEESRFVFDGFRSWFYDLLNSGITEVKGFTAFCSCCVAT